MKVLFSCPRIVALIATSCIFSTTVTGVQGVGGWYIDEETCGAPEIAFLNKYLNRARVAHINVATYFAHAEFNADFHALLWKVVGGRDVSAAWAFADQVFAGSFDPSQDDYNDGLASWKGPVSAVEATNCPNGLIVYCNPSRLGQVGRYRTYDQHSGTYFRAKLPSCPPWHPNRGNVAAVLIHYVKGQPDRITFCPWLLSRAIADEAANRLWDTQLSINGLRDLATRYSAPNGDFNIGRWRIRRLSRLTRSYGLPDIDVSVGFDTFLTGVLAHTSAGGLKGNTFNFGQEVIGNNLPPVDSWRVNQATDPQERPGKALPYMPVNSIINNIFAGFSINEATGDYQPQLSHWYPQCNFMVDSIPFDHQLCAQIVG